MNSRFAPSVLLAHALLAEASSKELNPQTRVKMIAAVAAIAILGFLLAAMIWLGGRFTRRYINRPMILLDKEKPQVGPDDWANKRPHRQRKEDQPNS